MLTAYGPASSLFDTPPLDRRPATGRRDRVSQLLDTHGEFCPDQYNSPANDQQARRCSNGKAALCP